MSFVFRQISHIYLGNESSYRQGTLLLKDSPKVYLAITDSKQQLTKLFSDIYIQLLAKILIKVTWYETAAVTVFFEKASMSDIVCMFL